MKKANPKTSLLGHSKAKVDLYGKYLSAYISILGKVKAIERVFLFDLLCGEGIYENGGKGSPVIAMDVLARHYSVSKETRPKLKVLFNDIGDSDIEQGISKVERVRKISKGYSFPSCVELEFSQKDYDQLLPQLIKQVENHEKAKALFFIDPYGYKNIKPSEIKDILSCGNSEILLFLPIAHMYRFVIPAIKKQTSGSEPLKDFLMALFGDNIPEFSSVYEFIAELKKRFKSYLSDYKIYVDTFTIERNSSNIYSLFFFTSSIRGYEKMLETKWNVDPERGKGFTQEKTLSFLNEIEISGYAQKLESFMTSPDDYRTNREIFEFGLEHGFLPRHSDEVIEKLRKKYVKVEIFSLDEKRVRGSFTYINNKDRSVGIRIGKETRLEQLFF